MSDNDAIVYYNNPTPVDPNRNLNVPPAERTVKDRFKEIDVALPSPLQVLADPQQAEARVRPIQNIGQDSSAIQTGLSQNVTERARVEYLAQKYENDRNYEEGRAPFAAAQGFVEGLFGVIVAPVKKIGEGAEQFTRAYANVGAGHYALHLNDTNKDIANTQAVAAQNVAVTQANGQVSAATVTANAGVQIAGIQSEATIQATQITAESNQAVAETNGRWGVEIAKNTGPSIVNTNISKNELTANTSTSAVASPITNIPVNVATDIANNPTNNLSATANPVVNANPVANATGTGGAGGSSTANPNVTATGTGNGYGGNGGSSVANPIVTATGTGNGYGGAGGSANLHNEVVLPAPPITTN